jgi:hypothetical protein
MPALVAGVRAKAVSSRSLLASGRLVIPVTDVGVYDAGVHAVHAGALVVLHAGAADRCVVSKANRETIESGRRRPHLAGSAGRTATAASAAAASAAAGLGLGHYLTARHAAVSGFAHF